MPKAGSEANPNSHPSSAKALRGYLRPRTKAVLASARLFTGHQIGESMVPISIGLVIDLAVHRSSAADLLLLLAGLLWLAPLANGRAVQDGKTVRISNRAQRSGVIGSAGKPGLRPIRNRRSLGAMNSKEIHEHITELVQREQDLRQSAPSEGTSAERASELKDLEIQLDRCWDLLRQRRARSDAGANPNDAQLRSVQEVEGYRQ